RIREQIRGRFRRKGRFRREVALGQFDPHDVAINRDAPARLSETVHFIRDRLGCSLIHNRSAPATHCYASEHLAEVCSLYGAIDQLGQQCPSLLCEDLSRHLAKEGQQLEEAVNIIVAVAPRCILARHHATAWPLRMFRYSLSISSSEA